MENGESTDIASISHSVVCVLYVWNKEIVEYFLFCEELTETTRAVDIFRLLDDFMHSSGKTGTTASVCNNC